MDKEEKFICECHGKEFKHRRSLNCHLWHHKNKEKRKEHDKEYDLKNKTKRQEYNRKNIVKISAYSKQTRENNLKSWEGYIPDKVQCEVCGRDIFFNKKDPKNAIHFDHRYGENGIKAPIDWLGLYKRTPEKQIVWESFKFGMLCRRCNFKLPTKNRKEFLLKVIKYVFGEDYNITKGS